MFSMYVCVRKCRVAKNMRLSWSGLWLLLLLLYTDIVNTSVSILSCPTLSDPSGRKSLVRYVYLHKILNRIIGFYVCMQRWYFNGTMECFVSEHIPLATLAIFVLILSVLAVLFMAAIVMRKIKVNNYN